MVGMENEEVVVYGQFADAFDLRPVSHLTEAKVRDF